MGEEKAKFKLCCGGRGCPEVIKLDNNNLVITDDDGGKVVLTKEEALFISEAVDALWNS